MRIHNTKGETVTLISAISMAVLFLAAVIVAIVLSVKLSGSENKYNELKEQSNLEIAELQGANAESEGKLIALTEELSSLEDEYAKIALQLEEIESTSGSYKSLRDQLTEKKAEIEGLKKTIKELSDVYYIDISAQAQIVNQLSALLESGAPDRKVVTKITNEDGSVTEKTENVYPNVSLYYLDLTNGYTYSYNCDNVFESADCMYAPYALSLIKKASVEVRNLQPQLDRLNEGLPSGTKPYSLTNLPAGYSRVYNFDKIFTYTSADRDNGSGVIKDAEDGAKYSYKQLIEYMLKYSDTVAFNQLNIEYGMNDFWSLAATLNTDVLQKKLTRLTAEDATKVMKAIYEYIDSDDVYSDFLYKSMTDSAHATMISYAVSGKKVAHKYGWGDEAYHDMAIVYDEHPYVVVFMSDLDQGGTKVDEYVRSLIKLVDSMHKNFYVKK